MSESNNIENKAVAIKYDESRNSAPVIVASGMGYMAEKICETAVKTGVPVYEDDSIASVLSQMKCGSEIPTELYKSIAEIYMFFLSYFDDSNKKEE